MNKRILACLLPASLLACLWQVGAAAESARPLLLNDSGEDVVNQYGRSTTKPAEYTFAADAVEYTLCYGWGCKETIVHRLDTRDLNKISQKIAACSTSAENELLAIRNAVEDMEKRILKDIPVLAGDIAGNILDKENPGRLDCVDSSSNTNTLLRVLQANQKFQYWKVYRPQRDDWFKPHWSAAVVTEDAQFLEKYRPLTRMGNKRRTVWVVDSWVVTFAHKPFLFETGDWKYKLDPWGNEVYRGLYERKLSCWK